MIDRHSAIRCYAGWNTDADAIRGCSSGGAAFLLGQYVITRLGGIVYATAITPGGHAEVIRAETVEQLEKTKGSKYVRSSFTEEIIASLKEDLEAGKKVLFVGTPCQAAGLRKRFSDGEGHLFLIDLLCHGTPPRQYLAEEIAHLVGDASVTDVRFRGHAKGDYHLSIWEQDNCLYSVEARKQPYVLGMLTGITLMEGCYECPFASPERVGDITLGDYIGLGDDFDGPGQHVSYISVNTPGGVLLYDLFCRACPEFQSRERPVSERLAYRSAILQPAARHPLRDRFLTLLPRLGFARAIRRTVRGEMLRRTPLYRTLHHLGHRLKDSLKP